MHGFWGTQFESPWQKRRTSVVAARRSKAEWRSCTVATSQRLGVGEVFASCTALKLADVEWAPTTRNAQHLVAAPRTCHNAKRVRGMSRQFRHLSEMVVPVPRS